VRRWWRAEGFGDVTADDGTELFARGLSFALRCGQRVRFDVERDADGRPRAVNLRPAP
jgi:cold shock CspA family protein